MTAELSNQKRGVWIDEQLHYYAAPWRLIQVFIPHQNRQQQATAQALLMAIANIPFVVSDEDTALRKLEWWYTTMTDCLDAGRLSTPVDGMHPGLRQCQELGLLKSLDKADFNAWIQVLIDSAQVQTVSSVDELWVIIHRVGLPMQKLLNQMLDTAHDDEHAFWCSAWLLLHKLENISGLKRFWSLIPLPLRARYQLQIDQENKSFKSVCQSTDDLPGLFKAISTPLENALTVDSDSIRTGTAWLLGWLWLTVIQRRSRMLSGAALSLCNGEPLKPDWRTVFNCWQVARRHARIRN